MFFSTASVNILDKFAQLHFLGKVSKDKAGKVRSSHTAALFFIIRILENTDKKAKLLSLEELITKKSIELSMRQQVEQSCRKVHFTFSVILEQSEANMTQ